MRILITSNSAWNILHFRSEIIIALKGLGCEVIVIAPPDSSVAPLIELGCEFISLEMSPEGLNPFRELNVYRSILTELRRNEPFDAILSFTIKNNILGAMAAKRANVPFIPNVTGLGTAFLSSRFLKFISVSLSKLAFKNLPIVFFQNKDDVELFQQLQIIDLEQARILPGSGINLDKFLFDPYKANDDAVDFLMISRVIRDKGVEEYINAARIVKAERPNTRFQLLGSYVNKNRSAISVDEIREWQREGIIEYLEETHDVRSVIKNAKCVVLPSYREGKPRSLIEAAAIGRPLIATNVAGCRDLIENGQNGFLCQVRDAQALAQVMMQFMNLSYEDVLKMGWKSRALIERDYDIKLIQSAYIDALSEVTFGQQIK